MNPSSTSSPRAGSMIDQALEYQVKLGFIYNFTKFVEWPERAFRNADAPLSIGIVGGDPFSAALEAERETRKVGSHPIEVRTLRPGDTIGECQIVFIADAAKDQAADIVPRLEGSNTLTVGETEGFGRQGGAINFTLVGKKLQLEINPRAAERAGLISSWSFLPT